MRVLKGGYQSHWKCLTLNSHFLHFFPFSVIESPCQWLTVKPSQAYPPRLYKWIDYLKKESASPSHNWCQIQSGISACVMSREYFTRTSLYLVRLEIFEWIKLLRRHLHQFPENGAGRNFITASRVNSRLITHTRMQRSIWNLQLTTDSTFQ